MSRREENKLFIRDIPKISKMLKDANNLAALKKIMPICRPFLRLGSVDVDKLDATLLEAEILQQQIEEMAQVFDRFNQLFASQCWIAYEHLNFDIAKQAIEKAENDGLEVAEEYLVDYYSTETVLWHLNTMKAIKAFFPRFDLAQKALSDYESERYYASTLVVLSLLDGLVNELHEKRRGFFADEADLTAWDSISAHSSGLNKLARILRKSRNKITTEMITIPYRNGIMHGTDLGYDNKIVAAKSWAALFAVRDWAIKAEQGILQAQPEEVTPTWQELFSQINENQKTKKILDSWKPRDIQVGIDIPVSGDALLFSEGTPEKQLVQYLTLWTNNNYGYMAQCIDIRKAFSIKEAPHRLRQALNPYKLKSFELISVRDTAPAESTIQARLNLEKEKIEIVKVFDFRLLCQSIEGEPLIFGQPNVIWKIVNWQMFGCL